MKSNFVKWISRRPENLTEDYLKKSNLSIYISLMFLVFLIFYNWTNNPYRILDSSNNLLVPFITMDMLSISFAKFTNGVFFGAYDFIIYSMKITFGVFKFVAYWGVLLFFFMSLILGFLAGAVKNNKSILLSYLLLSLSMIGGFFILNIYVYFVIILSIFLVNLFLLKNVKGEGYIK